MANRRKASGHEVQGKTLLLLTNVLLILMVSGCERSRAAMATPQQQVPQSQRSKEADALASSAKAAFAEGDFDRCESDYTASARLGVPTQRAQSLYGASRCAARRGGFETSLFHLHAAASAGFCGYILVVNDPLLRPLYGHARWQLVLGLIEENFHKSDKAEASSMERSASEQIPFTVSFATQDNSSPISRS